MRNLCETLGTTPAGGASVRGRDNGAVRSYRFAKGHGTENDFVVLPDEDGAVHCDLSAERVRALCDRRAGIGGDGVLRAVQVLYGRLSGDEEIDAAIAGANWFMDYRNADGSLSEMCGNGIRVLARYLFDEGLESSPMWIQTRDGIKEVRVDGEAVTVDMGVPEVGGHSDVTVGEAVWSARRVSTGNPHAVAFVDDLAEAGPLTEEPGYDREVYPEGVNVEFVARVADGHVAMRVHERGSGETRSCGTGACAVMVATALADGRGPGTSYTVDVPGGRLRIEWTPEGRVLMTGPAVMVAYGETAL